MRGQNEKGGILLELFIMAFILLALTKGAAEMHRSFHQRFERILEERNQAVRQLRQKTP